MGRLIYQEDNLRTYLGKNEKTMKEQDQFQPIEENLDDATRPVMICLLGNFRLLVNGEQMPIQAGGKIETLLALLALQSEQWIPRERLVQALWADSDLSHGLRSLKTLIYNVHKLLGPVLNDMTPVLNKSGYYRLNIQAGIGVDVNYFDLLVVTGDKYMQSGNQQAAVAVYRRAEALYQGDLWLAVDIHTVLERERLRGLYLSLLTKLARQNYEAGDYTACTENLWKLLDYEPGREDAHRLLMRCYVRRGERSSALHQFKVCVEILRSEFNIEPEQITRDLYDQICTNPADI
jgi:DNA-binding SARP family transcriptional activator